MSSQSRPRTQLLPTTDLSCSFCACGLTEKLLALQAYPSTSRTVPEGIPDHGGLTLCPECAPEVVELVDTWEGHDHPDIAADQSIGDGYRNVTESCSFCAGACGDAVVGIELYRRVSDQLPAYANYTLCDGCQDVFGEFLTNVRATIE